MLFCCTDLYGKKEMPCPVSFPSITSISHPLSLSGVHARQRPDAKGVGSRKIEGWGISVVPENL